MPGACFQCASPQMVRYASVHVSNLQGVAADGTKLAHLNGTYKFGYLHGDGAVYGIGPARHPKAVLWHDKENGRWVLSRAIGACHLVVCKSRECALPTSGWKPSCVQVAHIPGPDFSPYMPQSINELRCLLVCYGVDISQFGSCSAYHKSLKDLWWETQKRVCSFEVFDGVFHRVISCLRLTVYCDCEGVRYELREENEIRGDGKKIVLFSERQSFMKKLFQGEAWREGVVRALALDLRVRDTHAFNIDSHHKAITTYESHYPGLLNISTLHDISVELKLPIQGIGEPLSGEFVTEEESLIGPSMQRLHSWRWIDARNVGAWKTNAARFSNPKIIPMLQAARSRSEDAMKSDKLRGGRFSIPTLRPQRSTSNPVTVVSALQADAKDSTTDVKHALANQSTQSTTFGTGSRYSSSTSLSFTQMPLAPDKPLQKNLDEKNSKLPPVTESKSSAALGE
eukprot:GEMP01017710.1.p1 GENE.GEMP01017710.1~~GEMP01017710.1.p1  ORF type:complete len:455 (+),score=61.84 GEMP01017710.1:167-1531(+)